MTGEMHKSEVTRENFPLYFAAADKIPRATVEPFDQYQGPYIKVPNGGTIFLIDMADRIGFKWYNTLTDCVSTGFLEGDEADAVEAFADLIKNGGTKLQRDASGEVIPDAAPTLDLDELLEQWQVHSPGEWKNKNTPTLGTWYAVSNDDGIVAYFGNKLDACRFRLNEVNRALNG